MFCCSWYIRCCLVSITIRKSPSFDAFGVGCFYFKLSVIHRMLCFWCLVWFLGATAQPLSYLLYWLVAFVSMVYTKRIWWQPWSTRIVWSRKFFTRDNAHDRCPLWRGSVFLTFGRELLLLLFVVNYITIGLVALYLMSPWIAAVMPNIEAHHSAVVDIDFIRWCTQAVPFIVGVLPAVQEGTVVIGLWPYERSRVLLASYEGVNPADLSLQLVSSDLIWCGVIERLLVLFVCGFLLPFIFYMLGRYYGFLLCSVWGVVSFGSIIESFVHLPIKGFRTASFLLWSFDTVIFAICIPAAIPNP